MSIFDLHKATSKHVIFAFAIFVSINTLGQTVLFTEDFDGGLSSEWTNTVIEPIGSPGWEWTNIGGSYGGQLNSASSANGYMILDSDAHGTDGVGEDAELISPSIDCSNMDFINLSLEHWARSYGNADITISVSADDFVSEGIIYNWRGGRNENNGTNPVISNFDISDYTSGESNVKIKFKWLGSYDYWWLIDDLKVTGLKVPGSNLTDLVYWLRSDLGVTETTPITLWADQSGNNNDASPSGTGAPDQIESVAMNNHEVMEFDGTDALGITNDARINAGSGYNGDERTMFVAFKTGSDVTSTQYIYEQGGGTNGIGVFIKNGNLYVTIYNDGNSNNRVTVLESVSANTSYIFSFNWNNGALTVLLNNVPFSNQTSNGTISSLNAHSGSISIGFTDGTTRDETGGIQDAGNYFNGEIAEILYYDASLLEEEELDITLDLADRYGISFAPITTYYSYQPGDWNAFTTWTHDPSGTTQTATDVPGDGDKIVILSGRTVTLTEDVTATNLDITIRDGGTLDQANNRFTKSLSALTGEGVFKLASVNYPVVTINDFVKSDGGTTEYYNTTNFTLPTTQAEYNDLRINAPSVTATQLNNITINGDLHVKQGTYRINDNSANRRQLVINGNVLVDNRAFITIGTGNTVDGNISGGTAPFTNYYDLNSHRVVVNGNFTNNGTVRFTNQAYPKYNGFPTNGMATIYFRDATDNTLTCNGTTDFYNLVLDKGIDKTYKLTVTSTAYNRFRLFGRNDQGGENGGDNPDLRKALWLRAGTLELTGITTIPSLTEAADNGSTPNGDFYLPVNAALLLNSPEVIVLSTADTYQEVNLAYGVTAPSDNAMGIRTAGGTQSFSIFGKLQVEDGYFSTRESGGIITWDNAAGELIINGGIVDAKQFRAAGSAVGLTSFNQNGGIFILRGRFQRKPPTFTNIANLKDFSNTTLNTTRETAGLDGNLGTFNLNKPENVFAMSGGIIRIYDVCGTAENEAFQVLSDEANNNVTGGTIEIIPTTGTGTNATIFKIETTAKLNNLTINRTGGTAVVDIANYPLSVLNNLTITSGALRANNLDLYIGGNFTLNSGTSYIPGTNTTTFNGANNQTLAINTGTPINLYNLSLNNSTGKRLILSGLQPILNVAKNMSIQKGELADNGKTINVTGNIFNAGLHTGDGKISLNGTAVQTIGGGGAFQNLELNNTNAAVAPILLIDDARINGTLTFSRDKLLNIATHNLILGASAKIANAGTNRFIQTAGNGGDGGLTRIYSSTTALNFPVGVVNYTPASIGLNSAPTAYGDITLKPVNYEHPVVTVSGRSLTYFWKVKGTGFDLGAATVNHTYTYANANLVTGGNVSEAGYIAAMYDNASYAWTKYATTDVNESTNTIGGAGTALADLNYIDGEFTAGDNSPTDPFGEPTVYYSRATGSWVSGTTWSTHEILKHEGPPAASFPGINDIVVIGGQDSVFLPTYLNRPREPHYAATLKIETGSVLDIGYNPTCNFRVVLNHENGNGNFRIACKRGSVYIYNPGIETFEFPLGDFSDYNINLGTTELYTTNSVAGSTFYLPNGVETYGNLIVSPLGGSNIIFPNNDLLIYGDLITRGQNSESWYCPNWTSNYPTSPTSPVAKTITIEGDFHIQGGALVWNSLNNTGYQDFIINSDLILDTHTGVRVVNEGNDNSQSITIGGNLINNSLASGGGVNEYRGANFTDIPLVFTGSGSHYITNDNATDNVYTVIETLTIDKGDSQANELIVDVGGILTTPTDNWLTLVNGTLKYLHDDDFTITQQSEFTIPSTAGLYVNSPGNTVYLANTNSNDNDVYLNGKFTIINGNVQVGNSGNNSNNDIEYSGGGDSEIEIQSGSLTVNGQIRRNPSTSAGILKYKQSGGNVTVNGRNANTGNAKFEVLNDGSIFNMSGGTITIVRGGGGESFGDLYLRPQTSTVTGGTIVFNPDNANSDQDYIFDANIPIWGLTINGTGGYNANIKQLVSPLTIKSNLLINNSGTLDANANFNIPITIKGNFTNNGTYAYQENLTTFSGGEQTISGNSDISFFNVLIKPVTSATLNKSIIVNNDIDLTSGTLICGNNYVDVKGDVTNNANYTDNATGIVLNGRDLQNIGGTGTWGQLELNNSAGARLASEIVLQSDFILTKGIFDINSKLLTLLENSDIVGSGYSNSKMIASDGVYSDVGIKKVFSSTYNGTTFIYPLGTSGKYTPTELAIDNVGNTGSIRINNINSTHPGVIDPTNVLNYFWEIESNGITNFNGNLKLNYIDSDVRVTGSNTEANYIAAHLLIPGTSWSKAASGSSTDNVNETNDIITFNFSGSNSLSGEYTAGIDEALPDEVPEFVTNQNGNWSNPVIWTQVGGDEYELTGAPNGFIIKINEEHTVTTDASYASAYRISIGGKLKITNTSYGHNLGTVTGSGTLYLENGTIPAGRYVNFFECATNSTLEYGGSSDYTVIADLYSSLANLHFTGIGSRILPNKDLSICNQLLIDGPIVDNSANNNGLSIGGTIERYNSGSFVSGTGANATVTFAGSAPQTVGGALGNFTGSNAFNNLEIKNGSGLTINNGGDVEVTGNLMLTNGHITTSAADQLAITNTNSNSVVPAGGKVNSFVNGPLIKTIIQGGNFNFPIGKEGELGNKLVLTASQAGTIEWTAEYFTPNDTYTSYNAPLSYVNSYDRWTVSAATGSQAKVSIKWDANSDLTPANTHGGAADMRVAQYDESASVWNELNSEGSGNNNAGFAYTKNRIEIPADGYSIFSTACINTIKPRAKFTPTGPVCGVDGIPVSFSSSPTLNYVLSYTLDDIAQPDLTISSTPFRLPTTANGTYKLVSFTYDGSKTGAVDQSEITVYQQPDVPNAGIDQSICGGTQANISGSALSVGSVLWSIASGSGGSIVAPTAESTTFNGTNGSGYTLNYTVDNGGCTASDQVRIDFPVLAAQPGEFLASSSNVCQTESSVVFTVPNDATVNYTWSFDNNGDTEDGNDNLAITGIGNSIEADFSAVSGNGVLQVTASNACGESDSRDINIAIHPMPIVTLSNNDINGDNAICSGSDIIFTSTESLGLSVADYDFTINGVSVQNGSTNTYSTAALSNGDQVEVVVTSDMGCATTSIAQTISVGDRIWDGATSNNWAVSDNWSCGDVPRNIDDIIIPDAPTRMPEIASSAVCKGLTVRSGAIITLQGNTNFDIYGNWNNEGTFMPNEGTVNIKGNSTISGSADIALHNLVVDNGVTLTSSANTIMLTGDMTNNGAFAHNNGTISFNGVAVQNVSGNFAGANALNNVIIDNAQGINLTAGNKQINGRLTLTNGLLTSNGLLTLGQNATTNISAASGRVTSFVDGVLSKTFVGNGDFFFPIGSGSVYKPVGISTTNAPSTNTWTAQYNAATSDEYGILASEEIVRVSKIENWSITSSVGDAKVTLAWDETFNGDIYVDNTELGSLRVAHLYNSSNWVSTRAGSFSGNGATFGTVTSGDVITFDGSKGGPELFTLGTTSSEFHPLPVELILFAGKDEGGQIRLDWSTATETNNDYFDVQHSTDGANFQTIGQVAGAGTSATQNNYYFVHHNPASGINYYRLKQVDFDGNFEFHYVIAVHSESIALSNNQEFSIYPNPYSTGDLTIELDNMEPNSSFTLYVVSITGNVIYQNNLTVPENQKFVNLDQLNELAKGIYLVNIRQNTNLTTKRLIVY